MAELEQRPLDPRSDLAGYESLGSRGTFQLWIGGAPVHTESAKSAVAEFQKYELAALTDDGKITTFIVGTHTAKQACITAQPVLGIGNDVPYWDNGKFNHEAVIWPAGLAFDTYLERKAFLNGSMLKVGHLI